MSEGIDRKEAINAIAGFREHNAELLQQVAEITKENERLKDDPGPDWIASNIYKGAVEKIKKLEAERSKLIEALTSVLRLIDDGVLVRDISKDHEPGWAIKQLPLIQTLGKAKSLLSKFEAPNV